MVLKLKDAYGIWQKYVSDFPKANRFTLGSKIDAVFLEAIEYCFLASYAQTAHKIPIVERGISRVDLLKLLLQLAWDIGAFDNNKYIHLGTYMHEAGRMLGGWKRQLLEKTPQNVSGEK